MSEQRTFELQIRFNADNKDLFPIVLEVIRKAGREVYAQLMILKEANTTQFEMALLTDDMIEGVDKFHVQVGEDETGTAVRVEEPSESDL